MRNSFKALDRIIRGDATRLPSLQRGTIDLPVGGLSLVLILLAMVYGVCMGLFALILRFRTSPSVGIEQMLATMVKVPMLFLFTLLVTFPSLYVFNALVGSRLTIGSVLRLLIAAMAVMMAVLASFGPIVAFFAVSTTSYPFMKLLNVIVFAIAGFLGLAFLLQTLHRLTVAQSQAGGGDSTAGPIAPPPTTPANPIEGASPPSGSPVPVVPISGPPAGAPEPAYSYESYSRPLPPRLPPGALERMAGQPGPGVRLVFRIWVIVFGLVGAQMGWVLRPFIGDPYSPFQFFRERNSNFFQEVVKTIGHLFGGYGG
jgi:hypothetical protein